MESVRDDCPLNKEVDEMTIEAIVDVLGEVQISIGEVETTLRKLRSNRADWEENIDKDDRYIVKMLLKDLRAKRNALNKILDGKVTISKSLAEFISKLAKELEIDQTSSILNELGE
jgi:predicted lipase